MSEHCIQVKVPRLLQVSTAICVTFDFMAICPIPTPPKPYGGTISIVYTPRVDEGNVLRLLEWDFFSKWIETFKSTTLSAERIAHLVISKFIEEVDPDDATLHMEISTPLHLPVKIILIYKAER